MERFGRAVRPIGEEDYVLFGSPMVRRLQHVAVAAGLVAGLAACSSNDNNQYVQGSIPFLYNTGYEFLEDERYDTATAFFDEVERQYPYSTWARRAQLMSAYAHYLANNYEEAILGAQRFLGLHPGNDMAPYAYYLIAICHYEQIIDIGRDQQKTEEALDALREVIRRFPGTDYAKDAKLKIDLARDHLAGKEMEVGRFYQTRGQYVAALGRFQNVVEEYETTSHVPEALHRMTEVYLSLGIVPEAIKTAAVLGHNYPGSRWYRDSYRLLRSKNLLPEPVSAQEGTAGGDETSS